MRPTSDTKLPKVSFIIPTLNAGRFLSGCLAAIRNQDYPQKDIEIIVADAGSTDTTRAIAKRYNARIIDNPEILHEPGKSRASAVATGELLFFTDADNTIVGKEWLAQMVAPYLEQEDVAGLLPQTTAPPDSSGLNRYLGYLFTDPFTWFLYGNAANPHDYAAIYQPVLTTKGYRIYQFSPHNHPLFGLSQGVGIAAHFKRDGIGRSDDILAGIKLIEEGHKIAYVPEAAVYHYHVENLANFMAKYRWRVRNNLTQKVKGMGIQNRQKYLSSERKLRMILFIPYSLSLVLPLLDALRLARKWKDPVMWWHVPACLALTIIILSEYTKKILGITAVVGTYGK